MGVHHSKHGLVVTPSLTDKPWRDPATFNRQLQDRLMDEIRAVQPKIKPSIILVGPAGAGKSAFINSVLSISKGRKVDIAQTGVSTSSYTRCYDSYTHDTLLQNCRIMDCMGLEQADDHGICINDLVALLKGHITEGYTFNPLKSIDHKSEYYKPNPKFEDGAHCVVLVIPAKMTEVPTSKYISKIKSFQEELRTHNIPRVVVLTKSDVLCEEVQRDVSKIFRSVKVQNAMKIASEVLKIPQASIHPVKNYEHEIELSTDKNIPILLALRQIKNYADDRIEKEMADL